MAIKVLELFKGTGSVGKYCSNYPNKYEVLSLDIDNKWNADIHANILDWDYRQYPPHAFDIIWASPPCTEYSVLLYSHKNRVRDFDTADSIVKRTLEIIEYFQPHYWFIENPQTGLLKTREFMQDIPYYDVSYCKYGYTYRKYTRIWTNIEGFEPLICKKDCGMMEGNRHIRNLGNSRNGHITIHSKSMRYSIPQPLISSLFECASFV
jgi:hypothetical protein